MAGALDANIDAVWFAEKIEDGRKLLLTTPSGRTASPIGCSASA